MVLATFIRRLINNVSHKNCYRVNVKKLCNMMLCSYSLSSYEVLLHKMTKFYTECCCRKQGEDDKEVKIVAVDLQAMAPLPGVVQIQGDITIVYQYVITSIS